MWFFRPKDVMVSAQDALPGRATPMVIPTTHAVLGTSVIGPWPGGLRTVGLAMGCFWGAERKLWRTHGVHATAVGYQGGYTPNPTYQETCTGQTGHAETVLVVYDPTLVTLDELFRVFWENHDPTQGFRQGNDVGTVYRSAIYVANADDLDRAERSRAAYQAALTAADKGQITTEIRLGGPFYYAEDYHQQYLHHNPDGYCGLGGTGVSCPVGTGVAG
jgi:peptide-methionine (S)-S-oxide reductase